MGYYATGSGYVYFSKVVDDEKLDGLIERLTRVFSDVSWSSERLEIRSSEMSGIISRKPYTEINMSIDGQYYEDDVLAALNDISTTESVDYGEITFVDDYDAHWRFVWAEDEWVEQYGEIVWS